MVYFITVRITTGKQKKQVVRITASLLEKIARLLPLVLFLIFGNFGCFHIEASHTAVIRDAETHEPLKNTVVLLELGYSCLLPPGPEHGGQRLGIEETLTNDKGVAKLPPKFYALPPFLCLTDFKRFVYFKPGYFYENSAKFSSEPADDSKYFDETSGSFVGRAAGSGNCKVELYKMKHYLDYVPYRYDTYEDDSKYFKDALKKARSISFVPVSEKGVFVTASGKRFTRMYIKRDLKSEDRWKVNLLAFDEMSKSWDCFDERGKSVDCKIPGGFKWKYMRGEQGWPIYADENTIYYYSYERAPAHDGQEKQEGKMAIKSIAPREGNITALTGFYGNSFFTIEKNGLSLCYYTAYDNPHAEICFNEADLPESQFDDTLKEANFADIFHTSDNNALVVVKTSKYWHVYTMDWPHKQQSQDIFKELISFPSGKEVTAITASANGLFVAFRNGGIRKYDMTNNASAKEVPSFFLSSKAVSFTDVYSLIIGPGQRLYATTAENKIYRFSLDGIPDFQVRAKIPE